MNLSRSCIKYFSYLKNSRSYVTLQLQICNKDFHTSNYKLNHIRELHNEKNQARNACISFAFASLFFTSKKEETPEDQLITMIKRSILCIQRQEYDKAEQMLHLALKIAQEMHLEDGITYVYDIMANLAMELNQFNKSEKLFTEVMKRLFSEGINDDDIKILHVSAKLAHLSHLKGELEKAKIGFQWTLEKVQINLKSLPDDKDMLELYGLIKNWYGQLLMEMGKFAEAKLSFLEAYEILTKKCEKLNEEAIIILNNISVACTNLEENVEARKYLEEALDLAKKIPEIVETGVLKANLGLLYLKDDLIKEAKDLCSTAYRFGKKIKNDEVIEQAEYCLDQIKEASKK